jgi:hypothetical protein
MREGDDNNADKWYCNNCGLDYHITTLIICNICSKDLCPQCSSIHIHDKTE